MEKFSKKAIFYTILDIFGIIHASVLKNKVGSSQNYQNDSNVFEIQSLEWIQSIVPA